MLTNYPPCPACSEPDLYRVQVGYLRVRCADCGWDSGTLAANVSPATATKLIAAAVQQERARLQTAPP